MKDICYSCYPSLYIPVFTGTSAFLCRCSNDKCDPDTGECMDGETCIDGQPRGMGFGWRGKGCRTGENNV